METLDRMEAVDTDNHDRPLQDIVIKEISIFVDPFEDYEKRKKERKQRELDAVQERTMKTRKV